MVVSTADQVHALASVWAMNRGLSVYCEKPLAHSVHEARVVQETYYRRTRWPRRWARRSTPTDNYRRVVELVQSGAIGPVREAHCWCGRIGPGGGLARGRGPRARRTSTGTSGWARRRSGPTTSSYMPGNMTWNRWWDFGNGTLGDMGSHVIDLAFWALKLRDPLTAFSRKWVTELQRPERQVDHVAAHVAERAVAEVPAAVPGQVARHVASSCTAETAPGPARGPSADVAARAARPRAVRRPGPCGRTRRGPRGPAPMAPDWISSTTRR